MKMQNEQGQQVYFNEVQKNGKVAYIVKALSGQMIPDRDRRPHKTRTLASWHRLNAGFERNGYKGGVATPFSCMTPARTYPMKTTRF